MNNIILIAKNLFKILFRTKNSVVIYILLPIIGIIIPLVMFSNASTSYIRVGVINKDSEFLSKAVYEELKGQKRFQIKDINEASVNEAISSGKLDCALVIPEGFTSSYLTGTPKMIQVLSVQGVAATGWVESFLNTTLPNTAILAKASNGDLAAFKSLYEENQASIIPVETKGVKNVSAGLSITYLGIGFLIQFVLIGTQRTAAYIIKERKQKTLARIRCTPVKGHQFIMGNVFVNVSLVTLQTLATLFLLKYAFHVEMGVDPLSMMLVLFPLLVASVGVTLMLVAFAKNESQLNILCTLVIYPTCLVSGCFWDVKMMPVFMQNISHLFPQRWTLDAIESIMYGKSLGDVSTNILVVTAFALAFFAVAVYGFSRKEAAAA
ncbi:MAG: ABC transporter permease [Clostridia bacterium]|nr:ABC transporter permease [Clostridia bacterium]